MSPGVFGGGAPVTEDGRGAGALAVAAGAVCLVTAVCRLWLPFQQPTIPAFGYLLIVLATAASSPLWVAAVVSLLADLALNFFFMPPVGTFRIADSENWVALVVFLAVAVMASSLSSAVRARARKAIVRSDELEQLLEARRAADAARQNDAYKSTLLASLGHDLRTPLTTIRVAATNLRFEALEGHERRRQAELILGEAGRLAHLVENIVDMTRIEAGAIASEPRWTDPMEIIEGARNQVGGMLDGRQIDVAGDTGRQIRVDPRLTASAIARVLENASTYTPASEPLEVHASTTGERLVISVRDHGPGIPEAELAHVFDPFFRAAGADRIPAGTGLGLTIARGLLAAEGGRISAENHPDGGAVFTIEVPAAARAAPERDGAA